MVHWLPNFEDFFFSLGRLIESSEEQFNSVSCYTSEFLVCQLEEYKFFAYIFLSIFKPKTTFFYYRGLSTQRTSNIRGRTGYYVLK